MQSSEIQSRRHQLQLAIFVITVLIGVQFFFYVWQATGKAAVTIPRPPGVEGFLPIGALMAWKRFFLTGQWDSVHPAAMVLLGFAALLSLLLRKSFCSWFCPVGTLSEWLWKLGQTVWGKNYRLPPWLDYPLRSVKYLLLGFFVYIIVGMSASQVSQFLHTPYYIIADVKMLHFFTRMSLTTAVVLAILTIASVFMKNFWCRYACPYGALMGLIALLSPTHIRRDVDRCTQCKQCSKTCPSHIQVHTHQRVINPECTGCMDCILVCPVPETLALQTWAIKPKAWSVPALAVAIILLFGGTYLGARLTGHWQTRVPLAEFKTNLRLIDTSQIAHPSVTFSSRAE